MNNVFIITNPKQQIKWMCYDIFITDCMHVVNQNFDVLQMKLRNSSYGYIVNGVFRTKKWIRDNSVNVLGFIDY